MANVLMQPVSGAIQFNEETAGSSTVPNLSSDGIQLSQVDSSGLQIESHYGGLTGGTRFSIQGDGGQLLAVTDSLTGDIFSVNDASGLPIINVNSCVDDVITMGSFNTNALVVSGSVVGIGVADPDSKFEVKGAGCGSSTAVMRVRNCSDTELFRVQDNGALRVGDGTNIYLWNSNDQNFINYANWVASTGSQQVICNNGVGGIHLKANGTDSDIIFSASDGSLNEIMRIDGSTGNVGIGTSSPAEKLHVFNGSIDTRGSNVENSTVQLYFDANNGSGSTSNDLGTGITWKPAYSGYSKRSAGILQIGEGNYFRSGLAFYTNNTANQSTDWSERMRIDMDGNVGIGTTTPDKTLVVRGASAEVVIDDTDTTDTPRLRFRESGSTSSSVRTDACNLIFETGTTEAARFDTNGTLEIKDSIKFEANSYSQGTGTIGMLDNDILYIRGGSSGTLIQDNDGSEGIRVGGGYVSVETGSVSNRMRINSTGVGLGTATPTVNLDIEGSSNVIADLVTTTADANTTIRFRDASSTEVNKATIGYDGTNDGLILTTGGFTAGNGIFINDSQDVGIGTTNPTVKFHVTCSDVGIGTTYATAIIESVDAQLDITSNSSGSWGSSINLVEGASSSANTDVWSIVRRTTGGSGDSSLRFNFGTGNNHQNTSKVTILSDGKLGIGTTGPQRMLDVRGTSGFQYAPTTHDTQGSIVLLADGSNNSYIELKDGSSNVDVKLNTAGDSYFCCNVLIGSSSPVCGNNLEVLGSAYVSNNLNVGGTLTKCGGSFNINHPLPALSASKRLVHSFVEAPGADNIYTGTIGLTSGSATVNIDKVSGMTEGTYVALNRCSRVFTTNETNWDPVKGSISGNTLTIESCISNSSATVSWMVIGERQDPYMMSADTTLTDSNGKVIVEPDIELF